MYFGQVRDFWVQLWPKKLVSPTFQPDHQVNPQNRSSKNSKTAAASGFSKIGRSPPAPYHHTSSTGLMQIKGNRVEIPKAIQ